MFQLSVRFNTIPLCVSARCLKNCFEHFLMNYESSSFRFYLLVLQRKKIETSTSKINDLHQSKWLQSAITA